MEIKQNGCQSIKLTETKIAPLYFKEIGQLVPISSLNFTPTSSSALINIEQIVLTTESQLRPVETSQPQLKPEEVKIQTFDCPHCPKVFPTKTKLSGHVRVHCKSKYKCEFCEKEFSGPSPLKYHRWVHVGKGIRQFICQHPNCGKRFKSSQDLKRHNLVHYGTRQFKCDKCTRAFNLEWVLKEHKKIHEGIRPFECSIEKCGKAFYSQKDLKRHLVIHGSETPFKCSRGECIAEARGFRRKDNYLRHLSSVHGLSKDDAKRVADDEGEGIFKEDNNWKQIDTELVSEEKPYQINYEDGNNAGAWIIFMQGLAGPDANIILTKIMRIIFCYLSTSDLKACRLVCHTWKDVSTRVLKLRDSNFKQQLQLQEKLKEGEKTRITQLSNTNFKMAPRHDSNPNLVSNSNSNKPKLRFLKIQIPNQEPETSQNLDVLAQVAVQQIATKNESLNNSPQKRKIPIISSSPTKVRLNLTLNNTTPSTTPPIIKIIPKPPSTFEHALIFIGAASVGKSYLCNQLFRAFNSSTRFGPKKQLAVELVRHPDDGSNYTIIETEGLHSPNECGDAAAFNSLEGRNGCIIVSALELVSSLKGIVYVFRDGFTVTDAKTVKLLSDLVGFERVHIFRNKLAPNELARESFMAAKAAVTRELENLGLSFQVFRLWCVGIHSNPAELGKEWTVPLHNVLKCKEDYLVKNFTIPEVVVERIVRGPEYETAVNGMEDTSSLVERFWKGQHLQNPLGIPIREHFLEFRTYVNEYKVRYDGNKVLFRSIELIGKRRRVVV